MKYENQAALFFFILAGVFGVFGFWFGWTFIGHENLNAGVYTFFLFYIPSLIAATACMCELKEPSSE